MMVRDDLLALNYLVTRPEVDPARIAAMGMSMGSTRTWWIAALDDRIKVAVSVACLTRYQDMIATGEVNGHGIYYFVPGMLHEKIDTESVIGLIAPRAHLTLTGEKDAAPRPAACARSTPSKSIFTSSTARKRTSAASSIPAWSTSTRPPCGRRRLRWLKKHL